MVFGTPEDRVQSSYWFLCPVTREPGIYLDRYVTPENLPQFLAQDPAVSMGALEDAAFLRKLRALGYTAQKAKPATETKYEIHAQWSDPVWLVYDPNAPERVVPGTKEEAREQQARVEAQALKVKIRRAAKAKSR